MKFNTLQVSIENRIALVSLNRPKALNALNNELLSELSIFFDEAVNNSNIGAIIVTGSGEKAFVAGADIKEFSDFNQAQGEELAQKNQVNVFNKIENCSKPVIAAINGFALGGGLELAMACHIRIACTNAKMGLPEVSLGLIPGYGGTQRLPQLVGKGWANQIILSAQMIDAEKAQQIGLINETTTAEELVETCKKLAGKILKNAPNALAKAISLVNIAGDINGFNKEIIAFGEMFAHPNSKEGASAFIEKRKSNFSLY